jgi:outer membrane protein
MAKQSAVAENNSFFLKGLIIVALVFSIVALTVGLLAYLREDKIVYVDSLKLLTNYNGSKVAKEAYEKKVAVWKANIDTLTKEFNMSAQKYEREKAGMNAREKKLTEELLATKQQQLANYQQATAENASKEDKEVTGQVFNEVNDFLKKYGEDHGYEYIMGATTMGNIVYAKKVHDITDEVLKKLNQEYRPTRK